MTEQRIQDVKSVSNEQKTFDHYKQEDKKGELYEPNF